MPTSNEIKWSLKSDSYYSFIYSGVMDCTESDGDPSVEDDEILQDSINAEFLFVKVSSFTDEEPGPLSYDF